MLYFSFPNIADQPYDLKHDWYKLFLASARMEQHSVRVSQMPNYRGQFSSGLTSMILSGQRELSKSQIKRLAQRFHVSPALLA